MHAYTQLGVGFLLWFNYPGTPAYWVRVYCAIAQWFEVCLRVVLCWRYITPTNWVALVAQLVERSPRHLCWAHLRQLFFVNKIGAVLGVVDCLLCLCFLVVVDTCQYSVWSWATPVCLFIPSESILCHSTVVWGLPLCWRFEPQPAELPW